MSLNDRQEAYCQIKANNNVSNTEAYRQAGYKSKRPDITVAKLVRNNKIIARIRELRVEVAMKAGITQDGQVRKLEEVRLRCKENGENSNEIRAIEVQSKHFALMTDKVLTGDTEEKKEQDEQQRKANQEIAEHILKLPRKA
jgi:hypothetical protein